jgi:hypothetical protein
MQKTGEVHVTSWCFGPKGSVRAALVKYINDNKNFNRRFFPFENLKIHSP